MRPKRNAKRLQSHFTWIFLAFPTKNIGRNMALSALDDLTKKAGKCQESLQTGNLHIERTKKRRGKKKTFEPRERLVSATFS
ncbi:hypothetical protein HMPREF0645_2451 [Hallella bergensis DSM 17361]|uniref:Uncharacterized protein n=1 Tax=Hallella bergensis DSM 17361 TaxID=585502 RepID=D1PZR6_9BACT|nr:hypothetical protein HMPREF0645_2451 [Hallella bergensis DSM 17361]